jgi:AbrB family looped-hinge helix DNA binding protein
MEHQVRMRRGVPGYAIEQLPYRVRVYINNQVLIPARLVRSLGISHVRYVDIILSHGGDKIVLRMVKLLKTRHTDSRQFTIPKQIRDSHNINPGDEVEIISIRPSTLHYTAP